MGFLKKLFGGGSDLAAMRRALDGERWAQALAIGEELHGAPLDDTGRSELEAMLAEAGDGLAAFNLEEAEACLRAGEAERALEHLALASDQVRTPGLAERISSLQQEASSGKPDLPAPVADNSGSCCSTGCSSEAASLTDTTGDGDLDLDEQTHLDLILNTYPPELAQRYLQTSEAFRRAFLLAHEGQEEEAQRLLDRVPETERDDLFRFERGALFARMGNVDDALGDLEEALRLNPQLFPALDALVRLELQVGRVEYAERRLKGLLAEGRYTPFCNAHLAQIAAQRGDLDGALECSLKALDLGETDPETVLMAASLLENKGRLGEAESLLGRLGGGGCSGGANLYQAEFWLRHGRHLDKALESFKTAARHEPDEPRWPLRMAQVYLARGWKKDGVTLLRKVLDDPRLAEPLREEGRRQLEENSSGG